MVALIAIMPPTIVVAVMIILLMTVFRDAIPDERTFRSHTLHRAPLLIVGSGATLKHEFFMVSNETTNPRVYSTNNEILMN